MDKLAGVHPKLVIAAHAIMDAMRTLGHPMIVTDGVRTLARQQELYAQGRTTPGVIVTNTDGIIHKSNHQPHDDGYGYAVDMTFLDRDGKPTWSDSCPWDLYGAMVRVLGLVWGGDWKSIQDRPHMELPDRKTVNA